MCTDILWACGLGSIRGGELDSADRTFRSALAFHSGRSWASAGDGMDGASAGASTVESSSVDILMPSAAERFITTPRLCTEIIEDSLPRMAHSERTHLLIAVRAGLAQRLAADMRAHLEATRERPTASPAVIAGQLLTGALKGTEPTQETVDSPAANEVSRAADRARRTDPLHMRAPAVRTAVDALAADMPAEDTDMPVVDTAAADTAANAKCFV